MSALVVLGELSDPDSNVGGLVLDGEDEWKLELDGWSVRSLECGDYGIGTDVSRADGHAGCGMSMVRSCFRVWATNEKAAESASAVS